MNKRQIEKLAAKVSSTYHIRFFMNKRETRIAIKFINKSHEIVGSIDAEKINEKDTYTVTGVGCDIKGIGKMLY